MQSACCSRLLASCPLIVSIHITVHLLTSFQQLQTHTQVRNADEPFHDVLLMKAVKHSMLFSHNSVMSSEHACSGHGMGGGQLHAAVVSECIPAFFLTPRIFLVLFFLSLICFLDLLTGASASPFCKDTSSLINQQPPASPARDKPMPLWKTGYLNFSWRTMTGCTAKSETQSCTDDTRLW